MNDDSRMPFGAHKGQRMGSVPASYLLWFHETFQKTPPNTPAEKELDAYIKDNLEVLRAEHARTGR